MKQQLATLLSGVVATLAIIFSLYSFADNTKDDSQTIQTSESPTEAQPENSNSTSKTSTQTTGSAWPGPL